MSTVQRVLLDRSAYRWTICLLVFCSCVLIFAYRGLGREFTDYAGFTDHAWNYLAARAWLRGSNPYSLNDALATIPVDFPSQKSPRALLENHGTPYPPAIFPLYAPFIGLDWGTSTIVFLAVSTAAYVAACLIMIATIGTRWARQKQVYFLCAALLMYPASTGLALGQPSVIAGSLLIIALCLSSLERAAMIAGALAAVSLAFKPQIGIIFFIYAILRARFVHLRSGIAVYLFLTIVALVVPSVSFGHASWVTDLATNISAIAPEQAKEYCCVNLRMITRVLTSQPTFQLLLELTILSILAALQLNVMCRHRPPPLLELSMLSIIILLSSYPYHQPYDAIVLLLLLAWIFASNRTTGPMLIVCGLALVFFQPVPTLGVLSTYFYDAWPAGLPFAWRFFVSAHVAWVLLALFVSLYFVAIDNRRELSPTDFSTNKDEIH